MSFRARSFARRPASLLLALTTAGFLLALASCSSGRRAHVPAAPSGWSEVVGTLVALKDDRPVDGGIDLTLETASGTRERVRVPSIFMAPPRDSVRAMHEVVDGSKPGDRLRARGPRDETGALLAEVLERVTR